jgi:hypothetical protein
VRRQARRLIAVAAVAVVAGCAAPATTRLAVHVDTLAPDKIAQYEDARVRFVARLRARGLSDHRGLYLKIGSHTYYSVFTFARWCELDDVRQQRAATTKKLGADAVEYDRLCDASLVFPHTSEIWTEEPALSYVPTGRRLTDAFEVVIEDVAPTADYEAAWQPIAAALLQAKFPVERRAYFSAYGSGRVVSFWLAPSAAIARAAPTIEQALTGVVGEARARELLQAWHACVLASQTYAVEPRADMSRD